MEAIVVYAGSVRDFVDDGDEHFVLEVVNVLAHVAQREPEDGHNVRALLAGAFGVWHTSPTFTDYDGPRSPPQPPSPRMNDEPTFV